MGDFLVYHQSYDDPADDIDRAKAAIAVKGDIDYFCGRCIKTDLSGDKVRAWLYNRDAGSGTFQRIVAELRAK